MANERINMSTTAFLGGQVVNLTSDTVFVQPIRGFMVTVAGAVKVDYHSAESGWVTVALPACQPGVEYHHHIGKIYSTANGTTATGVVALR